MAAVRNTQGRFASKPREDLSPAYRKRLERAEARGVSLAEARGHAAKALPAWRSAEVVGSPRYQTALEVLGRMRKGESLSSAARELRISPDTVVRQVGSGLTRGAGGRWIAKPSDRLVRRMRFIDSRGLTTVELASSREASKLAEYWNAVDHFLTTGDDRPLRRFRRMRLRTRQKTSLRFVTDLDELERFGRAGELSFEDLYQH
ncbi:MAG: hypothetical protein K1X67_20560 [Fimbriimonadaceae bacterium]|nr:hypothetical protein [Fimbriimonadaceae bacterium]